MKEIIIGIDLGTTNSEVGIISNGNPILFDENGETMLPSFVGLDNEGNLLVGEAAKNQYPFAPERTIKSIKREMGKDIKIQLGEKSYSPQEISAIILKSLKKRAESALKTSISKAVITVPAYFSDAQRQATREAAEIAGLEVVRIINEPTAACLAYEPQHEKEKKVLVYDLGGGTFDVSILRVSNDIMEVVSSHGNNHLGGDDFDKKLFDYAVTLIKEKHNLDVAEDIRAKARILNACIKSKIELSFNPYSVISEEMLKVGDRDGVNIRIEISRAQFENLIQDDIEETLDHVNLALRDAHLRINEIDDILLVGGSSRIPLITELFKNRFSANVTMHPEPDLCVALGASIQAGIINGDTVERILIDISPYSFGTRCLRMDTDYSYDENYCRIIIPRNSALPLTKSEVFYTVHPEQDSVSVEIYQGDSEDVNDNTLIGNFMIEDLETGKPNNPIILKLDLDLNGILHCTAIEKNTGKSKRITIKNAFSEQSKESIQESKDKIVSLFNEGGEIEEVFHSEPSKEKSESFTEKENSFEKNEILAGNLIKKAESIKDIILSEDQTNVSRLVDELNESIKNRNNNVLKEKIDQLSDLLFYLEL